NEVFDNNVTDPAYSSAISDVIPLEIVESHKIAYQKDPQAGATNGDYEYQKNVGAGTTIGKIQVITVGIPPLTYRISANGDQTYENFEMEGLDSNNASSASMLKVKIKANAPDLDQGSLKAGTYGFCVETTDFYDAPSTQIEGVTKVCTTLTVAKTTTSVAFDEANQTKKTISDANTSWLEKATATPQVGTKITYAVVGGDIGLIAIDADTGRITYQGNNAFGKVKIQAKVDDDPTTGNDNYTPATAEKEIVIVREVDGEIIPDSASSDANVPTFQANDANVKTGGTIGKIKGILGTPDTLGGTVTTYAYALKSGGNASFFTINATSGEIKTTANLAVGTYTFTVSVSDRWSSKDISVTVNVGMASAEALKFYENSTSNTVINTKSVKFTDTNISVFATVKGSTNNNPVTYQVKAGEPTNVIDVNASSGVVTIKGVGTVIIVAEKQGASGQADALAELTFTVSAGTQNFIYTTDSTLSTERPKTGNNYDALVESYAPNKTFQLYTTGNPAGSSVTYQLKAGSPSDVI
ncbi:MAG: cadherin repeat domain-containing protein, partial [Erysipelotrichaceae bacterium]|nr:cadherin repeat domain-containing protein [Erysipelotrichaceae bacterium]